MYKLLVFGMGVFYILAGLNHFVNPEFYYDLIPDYLPYPVLINVLSGVLEILAGAMIFPGTTRKFASHMIIAMLIAFIPSHVYFIQIGSCIDGGLCVPPWIGWLRLVLVHPILIIWAYWAGTKSTLK